eukprot:1004193-Prorocentrum_minimum.AAC.2
MKSLRRSVDSGVSRGSAGGQKRVGRGRGSEGARCDPSRSDTTDAQRVLLGFALWVIQLDSANNGNKGAHPPEAHWPRQILYTLRIFLPKLRIHLPALRIYLSLCFESNSKSRALLSWCFERTPKSRSWMRTTILLTHLSMFLIKVVFFSLCVSNGTLKFALLALLSWCLERKSLKVDVDADGRGGAGGGDAEGEREAGAHLRPGQHTHHARGGTATPQRLHQVRRRRAGHCARCADEPTRAARARCPQQTGQYTPGDEFVLRDEGAHLAETLRSMTVVHKVVYFDGGHLSFAVLNRGALYTPSIIDTFALADKSESGAHGAH